MIDLEFDIWLMQRFNIDHYILIDSSIDEVNTYYQEKINKSFNILNLKLIEIKSLAKDVVHNRKFRVKIHFIFAVVKNYLEDLQEERMAAYVLENYINNPDFE